MDPADEFREVGGHFTRLVEGVPDAAAWDRPAPVGGWTARDVPRHLIDWFTAFLAAGAGVRLPDGPSVDDDPVAAWRSFAGDVFLHSWDLARATGQDETLDPQRCAMMLAGMQPLDEILRASGQYGPKVPVPDDADVQTRLLGFIGRDPLRP